MASGFHWPYLKNEKCQQPDCTFGSGNKAVQTRHEWIWWLDWLVSSADLRRAVNSYKIGLGFLYEPVFTVSILSLTKVTPFL